MTAEFRHKIGDSLFDLWEWDGFGPETIEYPILRRTDRYFYIQGRLLADEGHLIRFSVAELERDGRAWNAANRMALYTRPLPHWPLMPPEVRVPQRLVIT